jgi:hypothetical protein
MKPKQTKTPSKPVKGRIFSSVKIQNNIDNELSYKINFKLLLHSFSNFIASIVSQVGP